MKKTLFSILTLVVFLTGTIMLMNSCKKDKFTAEDSLEAQQTIELVVRVFDASDPGQTGVSGVSVKTVDKSGSMTSGSTDGNGLAVFQDINISQNQPVIVSKSGYTTVSATPDITPWNFRESQYTVNIGIYPTDDSTKIAVLKGKLTIESDVTNRDPEAVPEGTVVQAVNNDLDDAQQAYLGTTNANGNYTIYVPVNGTGNDDIEVTCPNLVLDQTVAEYDDDNTKLDYSVKQVEKIFDFTGTNINHPLDVVPSVHISIASPISVGSGFALDAVVNPSLLTSYSNIEIIHGGDYDTTAGWYTFKFSPGVNGDTAELEAFIDGDGVITATSITNNGALYTSAPTLNMNDYGAQTQANLDVEFETSYDIFITNTGSNYRTMPTVSGSAYRYDGNNLENESDDDINDGTNGIDGGGNWLAATDIRGGQIMPDAGNKDTIYTTGGLASKPTFTVHNNELERAQVSANNITIDNNDSNITTVALYNGDGGEGYDASTPPAFTLTTLAGWGSGAEVIGEVDGNGSIENVVVMNKGNGYINNVNDFNGDGAAPQYSEALLNGAFSGSNSFTINNVSPGMTYVNNIYYGTGKPTGDEVYKK